VLKKQEEESSPTLISSTPDQRNIGNQKAGKRKIRQIRSGRGTDGEKKSKMNQTTKNGGKKEERGLGKKTTTKGHQEEKKKSAKRKKLGKPRIRGVMRDAPNVGSVEERRKIPMEGKGKKKRKKSQRGRMKWAAGVRKDTG